MSSCARQSAGRDAPIGSGEGYDGIVIFVPCRVLCGICGRNVRMGFLPERDIGASGTNVSL